MDPNPQLPDDLNPEIIKATAIFIGKITGMVPPPHNAFPPEWYGYLRTFTNRLYEVARENRSAAEATPAAKWRIEGEADPHGTEYDCARATLTLGKLTDDELANGVFMNGDQPMNIERVLARDPGYHPPIVWLTAAKERIRWLSRSLEKALASKGDA